jgi:SulP family sulfate permease
LTCFTLTVFFDMVLAVAVGIGLAAALFIRRMSLLTQTQRVETGPHAIIGELPGEIALYDINGPLFFGAAEKALTSLHLVDPKVRIVILDMHDVPSMDGTAIVALKSLIDEAHREEVSLVLVGLPARILVKLRRAGIRRTAGRLTYCRELTHARRVALRWLAGKEARPLA